MDSSFWVPKKNRAAYLRMARLGGKVWRSHGALDYKECAGDDLKVKFGRSFPRVLRAKPGEMVFFSYIVFKSRKHRDRVNAKVMKDPIMNDPQYTGKSMPFDMKRMVTGGFKTIVEA